MTTRQEAVRWVWAAHNKVNQRLAGDHSRGDPPLPGDPLFPKGPWPSSKLCAPCHKPSADPSAVDWDRAAVDAFLERYFATSHPVPTNPHGVEAGDKVGAEPRKSHRKDLEEHSGGSASEEQTGVLGGILPVAAVLFVVYVAFSRVSAVVSRGERPAARSALPGGASSGGDKANASRAEQGVL